MSAAVAASAALAFFPDATVQTTAGPLSLRVVMVAIAGAETAGTWSPRAQGDALSIYRDGGASEAPYSCGGYTSEGLWQINMPAHYPYLESVTGSSSSCYWAQWLWSPQNNAQAALAVYRSQGLGAWTTYQDGSWRSYLSQAQQAVAAAAPQGGQQPSTPSTGSVTLRAAAVPVLGTLGLSAIAIAAVGLGVGEEARAEVSARRP